jgi:long-chain acyl-CoA synthetase
MIDQVVDRAHPSLHARTTPGKAAVILAESGETIDFQTLDARSNQAAHLFRRCGAAPGDGVLLLMDNEARYFEPAWGAQRSGLYLTTLSTRLTHDEAAFIASDSGGRVLIASASLAFHAEAITARVPGLALFVVGGGGATDYDAAIEALPATPIPDESAGADMLYSSGTTGRPKGVRMPMTGGPIDTPLPIAQIATRYYGIGPDTVYLCPSPLYHAAPLRWAMTVQALGGTVVIMRRFDAEAALAAIERYRATASQWVPTHFVRMLKLPPEKRAGHDVSSMQVALHAAAPCPIPVKQAMIDWWGPVLHEYYAGTENFGFTAIGPEEWLRKPGSVGKPINCEIRICAPDGDPLPPGETGDVFFKSDFPFAEYHGDAGKTRESRNRYGWATYGDIGHVDTDGYLFLTDRRSFMIISGGVNIYPQEIENTLIDHPAVRDVAVIGIPDHEMGEKVVAVIEPMDWAQAGEQLILDITGFARARLSPIKLPRQIDFVETLPRQPTGKLFKRLLRDQYLAAAATTEERASHD